MALYYLGLCGSAVFALNAVIAAKKDGQNRLVQMLCGIITAIGGGLFLRDLALLHVMPHVFGAWWEVPMVIAVTGMFVGVISRDWKIGNKVKKAVNTILVAAESIAVLAFVMAGFRYGAKVTDSPLIGIIAGFLTAAGGGMISIIIRSINHSNRAEYLLDMFGYIRVPYFLLCLIAATVYAILQSIGVGVNTALLILVMPIIMLGFVVDKAMRN